MTDERTFREGLLWHLERGRKFLREPPVTFGKTRVFAVVAQHMLGRLFPEGSAILEYFDPQQVDKSDPALADRLAAMVSTFDGVLAEIDALGSRTSADKRVFFGHGHSPAWRELKDFISDRLKLSCSEFNSEAVAGMPTFERLSKILNEASFAFLVMTGEDVTENNSLQARQNVVHEVGLFQGRLGPRRAIILLEDGCEEFSNIIGLSQIRFPPNGISSTFEKVRQVLEREGLA